MRKKKEAYDVLKKNLEQKYTFTSFFLYKN